jgi:hypothetical protein
MVRTSLLYLLAGLSLGGLLLANQGSGGALRLPPLGLVHGHLLFVGWLLQFAIGIAYWLLPRRRTPERPTAYSPEVGFTGYALLNAGLLLRVVAEPFALPGVLLVISALLQVLGGAIFVAQLWGRARPAPVAKAGGER